jgi:3-deoxy-D-manno-octulosonic-acid transferase
MHFVYAIGSYLVFLVLLPFLAVHPKTRQGLFQRLGFYPPGTIPSAKGPRVWFHGASAGDLIALSPMIGELKQRLPQSVAILSTLTNSGYLMGRDRLRGADAIVFAPYDLPGATRRAMKALVPDVVVLEYTEIWPNLIHAAKAAGARVVLTNGRFSPKRLPWYRLLFALIGNPLRDLDLFLMREEDEAERALSLGASSDRIRITGNTKFDALLAAGTGPAFGDLAKALAFPAEARVLMAGSTHEGEEPIVLSVFRRLLLDYPDLRLVIAPRYIERAARIVALVEADGLSVQLRSKGPATQPPRVVVLDTIGELATAYGLATVVFVGGSFTHRGGQNILEPAAQGKPVLFGPNMDNFRDSVQILVGRGGIQVNDAEQLFRVTHDLLGRPGKLDELGQMAREAVSHVRGASARNVDQIAALMARPLSPEYAGAVPVHPPRAAGPVR